MRYLAFRTVKEALASARKHSEARHVQVRLRTEDGWLHGQIADDGRGFDVERALDRRGMRLHIGLDSMRERVRLAGGEVTITSALGQGARVDFALPLAGAAGLTGAPPAAGIMAPRWVRSSPCSAVRSSTRGATRRSRWR